MLKHSGTVLAEPFLKHIGRILEPFWHWLPPVNARVVFLSFFVANSVRLWESISILCSWSGQSPVVSRILANFEAKEHILRYQTCTHTHTYTQGRRMTGIITIIIHCFNFLNYNSRALNFNDLQVCDSYEAYFPQLLINSSRDSVNYRTDLAV